MPKKSRSGSRQDDDTDFTNPNNNNRQNTLQWAQDLVPKFTGSDKIYTVSKWIQDVEDNAEIFEWSPIQTLLMARRALCGTAALWLKSEKTYKTWEELKTAIAKEFTDTLDAKTVHEMMSARTKRPDESYLDYMLTMKELGKRGKMPDYVAIKYIVDGIKDAETNKLVLYGVTTYNDFKEKLKIYETMKEKSAASAKFSVNEVRSVKHRPAMTQSRRPSVRCYGCGELEHTSAVCPNKEKGLKCFACNSFGHISAQCPQKIQKEAMMDASGALGGNRQQAAAANHNAARRQHGGERMSRRAMFSSADDGGHDEDGEDSGGYVGSIGVSNMAATNEKYENDSSSLAGDVNVMNVNIRLENNKEPLKNVSISGKSCDAFIDSGSEVNLTTTRFFDGLEVTKSADSMTFTGLGKSKVRSKGQFTTSVLVDGHCYNNILFHIVDSDDMPYDVTLGREFLRLTAMIMIDSQVLLVPKGEEWMRCVNCVVGNNEIVTGHISNPVVKQQVELCVRNYNPVQVKEAPITLKIVLKDDIPVSQRPRRISLKEQEMVEQQVNEWLKDGIIRVSFSEYSSPIVLQKKKDQTVRLCVDYRKLNSKIVKDEFPLPVIEDIIDKVQDAKVFSVLDLKNGFFHLKVDEESIPYTSFVTHHGQFEFLRAPFGLSVCPKYFMRFVSIIFRELIAKGILMIFIDDILIPAASEEEGLERLKQVLEVTAQYGLQINWKKAKLICREIEYLGHYIKDGEVRPSTEKTDAVMKFPEPTTHKQLHSFIGLTSYFRKYIEGYATIAKPLTDMLKKNASFEFNEEQRIAFTILKEKLASKPVLKIYNPRLPTELHTDASSQALAGVLLQRHPDGGLHPVHFMSRRTNEAQSKYSSYELEALAIVEAVKKFRHYLFGIRFKLVTDCKAFEMTLKKKELPPKVARWVLLLSEYDYEVEHRSGSRMRHVDALSRNPYVAVTVTENLHDKIKQAQDRDEGLTAIKEILQTTTYKDYWIDNEILYKGEQKQLVVPRSMEKEILQRIHGNGHFSKRKMKELLGKDYYMKDLDKKIEDFIVTCIPCLLATKKEGKQEGFLHPIEKNSIPLDTLHLDHVGPLTETKKKYNHILTMIDSFTKFVWLFPTKSTTSKEVLDKLEIHQQTFGNPRRLITDRGTAFTSNEFAKYCEEENIEHVKITTGVPRANGQVERIHRTIIPALSKLCIEDKSLWYKHVSRVQRALNSTYQRSVDTTPFELLTGTKMRIKEDLEIMEILQKEDTEIYNENREEIRRKAKKQIQKVQEENMRSYNKNRKESNKYEVGDIVAIKRTQFGPGLKLKPKYLGPYQVTRVKRNDRYDLQKTDECIEGPIRTSSAADQMKRWPDLDVESAGD